MQPCGSLAGDNLATGLQQACNFSMEIAMVPLYGFYMHLALATIIAAVYMYGKYMYVHALQPQVK